MAANDLPSPLPLVWAYQPPDSSGNPMVQRLPKLSYFG